MFLQSFYSFLKNERIRIHKAAAPDEVQKEVSVFGVLSEVLWSLLFNLLYIWLNAKFCLLPYNNVI